MLRRKDFHFRNINEVEKHVDFQQRIENDFTKNHKIPFPNMYVISSGTKVFYIEIRDETIMRIHEIRPNDPHAVKYIKQIRDDIDRAYKLAKRLIKIKELQTI